MRNTQEKKQPLESGHPRQYLIFPYFDFQKMLNKDKSMRMRGASDEERTKALRGEVANNNFVFVMRYDAIRDLAWIKLENQGKLPTRPPLRVRS